MISDRRFVSGAGENPDRSVIHSKAQSSGVSPQKQLTCTFLKPGRDAKSDYATQRSVTSLGIDAFEQPIITPTSHHISRKTLPTPAKDRMTGDTLLERFPKLRLSSPPIERQYNSPQNSIDSPFPVPPHNASVNAANLAWAGRTPATTRSPINAPAAYISMNDHRPGSPHQDPPWRRTRSRQPPVFHSDDSENDDKVMPGRPSNPFSNINFFQSRGHEWQGQQNRIVIGGACERPESAFSDLLKPAARRKSLSKLRKREPASRHITRSQRSLAHHGTYEDPFDLDFDTDLNSDVHDLSNTNTETYRTWRELERQDAELARLWQEEEYERSQPIATRDCAVCGNTCPLADLPALANCAHRPETCTTCYEGWIASQLTESSWSEVKCPGTTCKVKLAYQEIQLYATREVFQQYDTFIARAAISEDRKFSCSGGL